MFGGYAAVFVIERTFELLEDEEGVLDFGGALFDVPGGDRGVGLLEIMDEKVVKNDDEADGGCVFRGGPKISEFCLTFFHEDEEEVFWPSSALICLSSMGSSCKAMSAWLYSAVSLVCWVLR